MSKVIAEKLLAGIIFGDADNNEYIYLPGVSSVSVEYSVCWLK